MARKTVFCVAVYRRLGRSLVRARLEEFGDCATAAEAAQRALRGAAGVVIFRAAGSEADAWETEVLATLGEVPPGLAPT